MSPITLVHPAKAVGRNEMPFGRDTRVVHGKGRFRGSNPQFAAMQLISKLL